MFLFILFNDSFCYNWKFLSLLNFEKFQLLSAQIFPVTYSIFSGWTSCSTPIRTYSLLHISWPLIYIFQLFHLSARSEYFDHTHLIVHTNSLFNSFWLYCFIHPLSVIFSNYIFISYISVCCVFHGTLLFSLILSCLHSI